MTFPECEKCTALLEESSRAIRAHLQVLSALESAVRAGQRKQIAALENARDAARERSAQARREYREHRATAHGAMSTRVAEEES